MIDGVPVLRVQRGNIFCSELRVWRHRWHCCTRWCCHFGALERCLCDAQWLPLSAAHVGAALLRHLHDEVIGLCDVHVDVVEGIFAASAYGQPQRTAKRVRRGCFFAVNDDWHRNVYKILKQSFQTLNLLVVSKKHSNFVFKFKL